MAAKTKASGTFAQLCRSGDARRQERALARQGEGDGGADALLALDAEPPAVQLDEPDRERQAEAGAGMAAAPGARHLAEARDRGLDFRRIHADAVIADRDAIARTIEARRQQHAVAALAELHGVGDEIEHDL